MKILLTKGKSAIIDDDALDLIGDLKWHYQEKRKTGYAIRTIRINGKNVTERMHRIIVGAAHGTIVDHINGDGLDNRRENLRIVSHKENCINRRSKSSKTGFKGVCRLSSGCFVARIGSRKNHRVIGYFKTAEEAARAYDAEAKKIYGNIAVLNFEEVKKT